MGFQPSVTLFIKLLFVYVLYNIKYSYLIGRNEDLNNINMQSNSKLN